VQKNTKPIFDVFYPREWRDDREREEYDLFVDEMMKIWSGKLDMPLYEKIK